MIWSKREKGQLQKRKVTFVLATPISGPALICTPQSVSLDIELPTVFVMPTVKARRFLQYRKAINVSAVSPLTHYKNDIIRLEWRSNLEWSDLLYTS